MQAFNIPSHIAVQATVLNQLAGTLKAWAFLASHGYSEQQIFMFLTDLEGPEHCHAQQQR